MPLFWNGIAKDFVVYASNVSLQSCKLKLFYIEICQNY